MLDIIIVNYKSTQQVLACLKSIFDAQCDIKLNVFVIDNGSNEDVTPILHQFPQVMLKKSNRNLGFAKAVNTMLLLGNAPYALILNPDTFVEKHLFDEIVEFAEHHPQVAILGPKILNQDGSLQGSARKNPDPLTAIFGRSSPLTRWFPNNRISRKNMLDHLTDGHTSITVDWVSGACMLVRRKAVEQVGALDERFFMYWEDADWCRRMRAHGWEIIYYPQACVIHAQGVSSRKNWFKSTVEFHKSVYRLTCKYHETTCMFIGPLILSLLGLRFLVMLSARVLRQQIRKN